MKTIENQGDDLSVRSGSYGYIPSEFTVAELNKMFLTKQGKNDCLLSNFIIYVLKYSVMGWILVIGYANVNILNFSRARFRARTK